MSPARIREAGGDCSLLVRGQGGVDSTEESGAAPKENQKCEIPVQSFIRAEEGWGLMFIQDFHVLPRAVPGGLYL